LLRDSYYQVIPVFMQNSVFIPLAELINFSYLLNFSYPMWATAHNPTNVLIAANVKLFSCFLLVVSQQ